MIRSAKGSTQALTTNAITGVVDGYSKNLLDFQTKVTDEHIPSIRAWTRSYAQSIVQQIEYNNNTSKPPSKKPKVPPADIDNDSTSDAVVINKQIIPDNVLPEYELDRVYNLRVRDLQKELKNENYEFKPKWNKKQLQDVYLQLLATKYVKGVHNNEHDNMDFVNEVESVKSSTSPMKGVEQSHDAERIDTSRDDMESDKVMEDKRDHPHKISDHSIVSDPLKDRPLDTDGSTSASNQSECQSMQLASVSKKAERAESKLNISEVKKGTVANVRAAYMEAVEAKNILKSPGPTPARKIAKLTRSPLRTLVQSGMQSAKRILSSTRPKQRELPFSPTVVSSNTQEISHLSAHKQQTESVESLHSVPDMSFKKLPALPQLTDSTGYGQVVSSVLRNISAANTATNVPAESSAFKSQAAQASADARKAKIAEMRTKAKTVAASQSTNNSTTDCQRPLLLNSKQPLTVNATSTTNGSEARKQTIAAQIRAKHLGMAHSSSYTSTVLPSKSQESIETAESMHPITNEFDSAPVLHRKQSIITRPEDNYEISDKEDSDDDDSDSDSSEAMKRKKKIPEWAQRDKLVVALERQFSHQDGCYVDPDELFGEVESCDLRDIFGSPKKSNKYDRRASTGNWAKDRVTAAEKLAYKREHKNRILKQQHCQ